MKNFSPNKANLIPVLPSTIRDSKYRDTVCVLVSPTNDPSGANHIPALSYQSQGWTISAHPEGKRYAHGHIESQPGITIVTEANVEKPGVLDLLNAWLVFICNITAENHVHIPETSHLFLGIHQDSSTCNYYFVDHSLRTVFWLHTPDTISVVIPSFNSGSYLPYALEENYWIHVELFPGTASQYSAKALNELQVIFSHAHADARTSETLTLPYTAKECGEFIDILERSKDRISSPCVITYVAKLWEAVANHRFAINSGYENYRLSSNQSTLEAPEIRRSLVLAIISQMLLFGFPDRYEARFRSFWEDQLVDDSRWREHASETVADLKYTMSSILALLGASPLAPFSSGLIKASLFLCAFNLAVTSFLLQRQQRLLSKNIPTSVAYLKHWNTSYGFQPIAIVHSLPQALFVWALLLFSMRGFWMDLADLPLTLLLSTFLPVATILVAVGLGIWLIVRPRPEPIEDAMLPLASPPSNSAVGQKARPTVESVVQTRRFYPNETLVV